MRRPILLLVPFAVTLAACGARSSSGAGATSTDAAVTAQLMQSGVLCAPELPPPAVAACASQQAGASCTFTEDGRTVTGTCASDDGRLMCAPSASSPSTAATLEPSWIASSAVVLACAGKNATDACSVTVGTRSFSGSCVDLPGGVVACLPAPSMEPEPIGSTPFTTACVGDAVGASCTVTGVDPAFTGSCERLWCGAVACLPPPPAPPPIVTACGSHEPGAACTFTDDGKTIDGVCRAIGMRAILACLPAPPATPPAIAACSGDAAGASCTVQDDGTSHSGTCRQLPRGGPLICMIAPPPPIAAAIAACAGASTAAGDACSFSWDGHTVDGACRAAPDGTLVCSPACGR